MAQNDQDIMVIGNVGRDPEKNASGIVTFSLACNEKYTDKNGVKQETTEWFNVTCFERVANFCYEYVRKGDLVQVRGKQRTRKYTGRDGTERTAVNLVAYKVQSLAQTAQQNDEASRAAQERIDDLLLEIKELREALAEARQELQGARARNTEDYPPVAGVPVPDAPNAHGVVITDDDIPF